jgi:hypothetical protein
MFNIYRCEMAKLKHTKLYWAVWLPAILANLVSLMMLLPKMTAAGEAAGVNLREMFYRQGNVLTILGPFLFALITGYILSREYSDRTINQLFTYPVSRERIFIAKLFVIFTMILLVSALSCVTVVSAGIVKVLAGTVSFDIFISGIWMNLLSCLLSFGTIPLAASVSMVGKSVIPPMVLGTLASLVTLVLEIGHGMKAILFPWTAPYLPVREFGEGFAETGPNPNAVIAIVILSVLFIISLVFCLIYYRRSEVHSGS